MLYTSVASHLITLRERSSECSSSCCLLTLFLLHGDALLSMWIPMCTMERQPQMPNKSVLLTANAPRGGFLKPVSSLSLFSPHCWTLRRLKESWKINPDRHLHTLRQTDTNFKEEKEKGLLTLHSNCFEPKLYLNDEWFQWQHLSESQSCLKMKMNITCQSQRLVWADPFYNACGQINMYSRLCFSLLCILL